MEVWAGDSATGECKKFSFEPMAGIWEPKLALQGSKSYRVRDFRCGRQSCASQHVEQHPWPLSTIHQWHPPSCDDKKTPLGFTNCHLGRG